MKPLFSELVTGDALTKHASLGSAYVRQEENRWSNLTSPEVVRYGDLTMEMVGVDPEWSWLVHNGGVRPYEAR